MGQVGADAILGSGGVEDMGLDGGTVVGVMAR